MLEKRKVLDQIEVKANGVIFVKELNQVVEDGKILSSIPHRSTYTPDMSIDSLPAVVKPHAEIAWTQAVISAYLEMNK